MDADTMGLDACRDELARLEGWVVTLNGYGNAVYRKLDDHLGMTDCGHPHQPTLDAAFAAIPEEWDINPIRVRLCAGDGSVEGIPNGKYWFVTACAQRNDQEYDNAEHRRATAQHVGTRNDAIMLAVFRLAVKLRRAQ